MLAEKKRAAELAMKKKKGLRNVSIKRRDFSKPTARGQISFPAKANPNSTVILNRSHDGSDDGDTSIRNLNDSVSDMVSVGGMSMAGLSDQSGGNVQRVGTGSEQDDDMVSNSDV